MLKLFGEKNVAVVTQASELVFKKVVQIKCCARLDQLEVGLI